MNPLKRKQLSQQVSLELDMDFDKVDLIVRSYYSKIQDLLSSCEHPNIFVPELGTFMALDYRIDKKLQKLNKIAESMDPLKSMRNYSIVNDINQDKHKLTKLREMILQEKERKKDIRTKRYESTRDTEDTKSDLELDSE